MRNLLMLVMLVPIILSFTLSIVACGDDDDDDDSNGTANDDDADTEG